VGIFLLALHEDSNPELFQLVKDRNLEQQFFLLQTAVLIGVSSKAPRFTLDWLLAFHYVSAIFLDHDPGRLRDHPVHINKSDHVPPPEDSVRELTLEYLREVAEIFDDDDPFRVAAFALWKLAWIHPFGECNGRTARAYSYYLLCLRLGYWPPGEETVLSLMGETKEEAYRLLAACDKSYAGDGKPDLGELANYLKRLYLIQIESESDNM